ncbi:hypothetical protein [Yeosuana sp.]|uniref:hypothetical protein n=1 Tax=Yeosuana sp. TaxID=2529388 RepID=UPI0040550B6D|tara:strand:- start:5490 stop:6011 length:522 start_codon:yes stop_codon:yes gene_type:complete
MKNIAIGFIVLITMQLNAQNNSMSDSLSVKTIDGIVIRAFDLLSRKDDKIKNMEKTRNLYLPSAKFTILNHPIDSLPQKYETVSLDEFLKYMNENQEYYEKGFTQYELGKVVNEYNGIANVFQGFYAKDSENQEVKGITSYQLIYFNERWWISDLLWTTDTNGNPIPEKYLKN